MDRQRMEQRIEAILEAIRVLNDRISQAYNSGLTDIGVSMSPAGFGKKEAAMDYFSWKDAINETDEEETTMTGEELAKLVRRKMSTLDSSRGDTGADILEMAARFLESEGSSKAIAVDGGGMATVRGSGVKVRRYSRCDRGKLIRFWAYTLHDDTETRIVSTRIVEVPVADLITVGEREREV